jgi:hypothetical protein
MIFRAAFCALVLLFLTVPIMQTTAVKVNIVIDGDFKDWEDIPVIIEDPDDIGEDNGDIKEIRAYSTKDTLYVMLTVYGTAAPQDNLRYYYHILVDADNKLNTGFDNSMYEGNDTGVEEPIGADFYVQVGRENGADDGIEVHFLTSQLTDDTVAEGFPWAAGGHSMEIAVPFEMFDPLDNIGEIFKVDQTIMLASFQEGSANDWEVDWTEPAEHIIGKPIAVQYAGKLPVIWGALKAIGK